jgi:hypothetical protein
MELIPIKYIQKNKRKNAYCFCEVCKVWIMCRAYNRHLSKNKHHQEMLSAAKNTLTINLNESPVAL